MSSSLARRIFLAMLSIGLINAVVILIATEVVYEDIEEANLTIALAQERDHFASQIEGQAPQSWRSALLQVFYLPRTQLDNPAATAMLPELLRNRAVPFAEEVEVGNRTYLVSVSAIPEPDGVMYLAQDISIVEDREDLLQEVGFAVLAVLLIIICLLLALVGARYVTGPLKQLTRQIQAISPEHHLDPISPPYQDRELEEIRQVLNELLTALNTYIQREKGLVGMASHELRTPVAVISGALDVMEQRGSLAPEDQRTLARIRQATDKMQSDISALLKLARRPTRSDARMTAPDQILAAVVSELEASHPDFRERIHYQVRGPVTPLAADGDLVHMLVRNLLQNAVRHTRGPVTLTLSGRTIDVHDTGPGLPEAARQVLTGVGTPQAAEQGLGLYIVRLLAERLNCELELTPGGDEGTVVRIHLSALPPEDQAASI